MNRARRVLLVVVWSLLLVTFGLACQSIAGIEDRTYDPQLASKVTPECRKYCDTVMKNCTGDFQVYSTDVVCLGVCANLEPGSVLEPTAADTVACRANEALLAASTGEPAVHCPRAGPGSGTACSSSNCKSYCTLFGKVCPAEFPTVEQCVSKCAALKDVGTFNAFVNHDGDTLQCRLVHVSSSTVEPNEHCLHARVTATSPCSEPEQDAPDCADFCRVDLTACSGELAVYESPAQCLAVCKALNPGRNADRTENTAGCRKYHAYSALFDGTTHCPHTGPGGDGHCGNTAATSSGSSGNCESYCTLLNSACSAQFTRAFNGQAGCISSCVALNGAEPDSHYSVRKGTAGGDTLQCRLLHLSRAFGDPTSCDAALGGDPCN